MHGTLSLDYNYHLWAYSASESKQTATLLSIKVDGGFYDLLSIYLPVN